MKLQHYTDVPLEDVVMEGAEGAKIRWLISQKDGAPQFATRMFEVSVGGHTPFHAHAWQHQNYVLEGEGALVTEDGDKPFKAGDVIFVPPRMKHSYKNTGDTLMRFLCIIPVDPVPQAKKNINPFAKGVANNC